MDSKPNQEEAAAHTGDTTLDKTRTGEVLRGILRRTPISSGHLPNPIGGRPLGGDERKA